MIKGQRLCWPLKIDTGTGFFDQNTMLPNTSRLILPGFAVESGVIVWGDGTGLQRIISLE